MKLLRESRGHSNRYFSGMSRLVWIGYRCYWGVLFILEVRLVMLPLTTGPVYEVLSIFLSGFNVYDCQLIVVVRKHKKRINFLIRFSEIFAWFVWSYCISLPTVLSFTFVRYKSIALNFFSHYYESSRIKLKLFTVSNVFWKQSEFHGRSRNPVKREFVFLTKSRLAYKIDRESNAGSVKFLW